jgi:2-C-methyl-D-erythritol 4-phosphate cytidylyltransferase
LDVVVGCRPVTDTIKTVTDGKVGGTVDRERLLAVASPIVLPPHVVAALTQWPDAADFAELVTALRERFPVRFVEVPPLGRRVDDRSALHVLAAAAEMHQD